MRFTFLIITILFISVSAVHSQISSRAKKALKKNNLEFILLDGFAEVTVVPNNEMNYDFAFKHGLDTFEVRYTIYPLKSKLKEFKKNLKKPSIKMVHPNFYWEEKYNENIRNLSKLTNSEIPTSRRISEKAVNEEFNADAAALTYFTLQSVTFSPEYKYCLMMILHKNFETDVYISYLGNDRETIEVLALEMFHALRFEK
jgi:spermidine/putrescine-binding protein